MRFPRAAFFILVSLMTFYSRNVLACSVCFGDPNSPQSKGLGLAVLFLMGVTAVVLGGVVLIVSSWARRAHKLK